MFLLTLSFFMVAFLYSIVGFGGGSSYIAILGVSGTPYHLIPKIALICNLLVVSGGCYHYFKNDHFSKKLILPFILSSVPMSYLGGMFPIKEQTFFILLSFSLILVGLKILFVPDKQMSAIKDPSFLTSFLTGGSLGLLSGMVGIGGGIFLSPILINMGWARSKTAAAVASVFILVNSVAGLAGQLTKDFNYHELYHYFPLFLSVIVAGQLGSRIGSHSRISYDLIQKGTGLLILIVSMRLLIKIF
ncbi:MAG: sulfite exporter TauE/SafE family protein [Bacteriovoracaceae bacterium]|nr:sulfite exporter TauE/SafE family protein [Bacteriovoracaceae bacterium]